jgi:hypothetical protein
MKFLCLLVLSCWLAAAEDLTAIVTAARATPAEFSADALLRIASTHPKDAQALIEQAFERAAGAQIAYKRRSAVARPDSPGAYWNRVYGQELDVQSLRLRAVDAMLPIDAAKAREMFEKIPPRRLTSIPCSDFLVYDVSHYYDALGALAKGAADGGKLLERYALGITSPVETVPAALLIAHSDAPDDRFKLLVDGFSKALAKISGDDRSFTASFMLGPAIQELAAATKRRGISPLPLLESYRVYLVIHLSAARCADDDLMYAGGVAFGMNMPQPVELSAVNPASFFNEKLRMDPLQPVQELETTPSRLEGVATGLRSCEDAECRAIQEQFRGLIFQSGGAPYPPDARKSPEWQARFKTYVAALAAWKEETSSSPAEHYRLKARAYLDLLGLATDGPSREMTLSAMLDFMARSRASAASLMEWFLPVDALIARLTLEGKDTALLREAKDPVISLYANLERVAPRPPDRLMLLN